jgi:transketolase
MKTPSMFTHAAAEMADSMGLNPGRANLDVFAETLQSLASEDRDVVAVTSDSRGSGKLSGFAAARPKQLVEVGIAEQNLVGVAAGLASCGKKVFAVSPACFLTSRSLEQIKVDVCYSDNPVTLVGISAGVSYGALGSTHHSLHDIAALRAIHNVEIIAPADNTETREAVRYAATAGHPVYLRFGKAAMFDLPGVPFESGQTRTVREGGDVALIAAGETVVHALLAAGELARHGISCRVVSMHTIKPLDVAMVRRCARECGAVITIEEHSVHGGLGEAVAAVMLQAGECRPMRIMGIPDEYTCTGSQADIFRHYGLSMEGIAHAARELLGGKR